MPKTGSGRIAAHVSAWADRWPGGQAGPWAGDPGANFGGVPIKSVKILALWPNARIKVEVGFGADRSAGDNQWNLYDVTTDVLYSDNSSLSIDPFGRSDETSKSQPAGCRFRLLNTTGNYTPYLPTGVYYPDVERKPPVRVSFTLTGDPADAVMLFEGFANGFVPSWDTTANLATVSVSASGATRRLTQGASPLDSPMRRSIVAAGPKFYWPFEDNSESTQIASGLIGGTALVPSGTITYANSTDLPGTKQALTLGADTDISFSGVTSYGGKWQVDWYTKLPSGGFATETILIRIFTNGTVALWDFVVGSGYQAVHGYTAGGTLIADSGHFGLSSWFLGQWIHLRLMAKDAGGGNVQAAFVEFPISGAGGSIPITGYAGTPGDVVGFIIGIRELADLTDVSMAHLAIYDKYDFSATDQSARGYAPDEILGIHQETADARIQRLCDENNLPVTIIGTSNTVMGAQSVDTLMNLLRECESADHGSLFDGLGPGIGYVTRTSVYNQSAALTVDASAGQFTQPFEPRDDDQRIRNKVTVTRKGGSSATFEDVDGPLGTDAVGVYDESKTLALETDADAYEHAGWEVHLGTVQGFRYPKLVLDFNVAPSLLDDWLHLRLLNRIDVTNVSNVASQHPSGTISLIAEGWSISLSQFDFRVSTNCSPYEPYAVGLLDTSGYLDCGASTLRTSIDSTATSISVLVGDTCFWTHSDGDYNILMGGEEMTVTAVGAASSPQTLTVTRSVNGVVKSHGAGEEVHVADPFILAL